MNNSKTLILKYTIINSLQLKLNIVNLINHGLETNIISNRRSFE